MLRLVSSLAGRLVKPGIDGFIIAYFAFLLVGLPELISLSLPGEGFISTPFTIPFLIICVAAAVYALLFQVFFLVSRILVAFFSHFSAALPHIVAGIAVFLIIGQPALHHLIHSTNGGIQDFFLYILVPGLAIVIFIVLILTFFFPGFKTINSALILIAVTGSRFLLQPLYLRYGEHSPVNLLIFETLLVLMSFALFATLQIRYRQSLSPDYDFFPVPTPARFVILTLLVPSFVLYCLFIFGAFRLSGELQAIVTVGLPLLGFLIVLLLQWPGTAWELNRSLQPADNGISEPIVRLLLLLLALSLTLFGYLTLAAIPLEPEWALAMKRRGVWSNEILFLTGVLTDRDGDGNSSWPGADPDDSDPCVRVDLDRACPVGGDKTKTQTLHKIGRQSAEKRPFFSSSLPRRTSMLITLAGLPEKESAEPSASPSELPSTGLQANILLASDEIPRALRALFQNLNGFEEAAGTTGTALFTRLSTGGFRTICGGWDAGRGYLSPHNPLRLDRGCQIYLPQNAAGHSIAHPDLGEALRNLHRKYREYRERKNFIWFHYDFSATSIPMPPDGRRGSGRLQIDPLIRQSVSDFSLKESLVLILFRGKNPIVARFLKYDANALRRKTPGAFISPELKASSIVFNRDIIGVQRHYRLTGCMGTVLDTPPPITYTYRNGRLHKFQGLTGARWSERIHLPPPPDKKRYPEERRRRMSQQSNSTPALMSGVADNPQKTVRLERRASD